MPKTPDEIKKGLECCMMSTCEPSCPYDNPVDCGFAVQLLQDALALIQQLQAENAEKAKTIMWMEAERDDLKRIIHQLEAERDAAVADLKELADRHGTCFGCKRFTGERCGDTEYKIICGFHASKWEWRGVQKEE